MDAVVVCNVLTASHCNGWSGYIGRSCRCIFVDGENLRLFIIEILTGVGGLVLENLDEFVKADGDEGAEEWAEPCSR